MRKWQIVLYGWVGSQSPRRARLGCRAQLTITRGAEKQQWDWVKGLGPFCASAGHSTLSASCAVIISISRGCRTALVLPGTHSLRGSGSTDSVTPSCAACHPRHSLLHTSKLRSRLWLFLYSKSSPDIVSSPSRLSSKQGHLKVKISFSGTLCLPSHNPHPLDVTWGWMNSHDFPPG